MKFRDWTDKTKQVRIKTELRDKLKQIAMKEDRTIYYILNKAVEEYLKNYE